MFQTGVRHSRCFYCSEAFEVSLDHTLFCSHVCKARYSRESDTKCFYCGDIASERDHIIPHSLSGKNKRIWTVDWVGSCGECNRFMGSASPFSLTDRIQIVIAKITRKYKLADPDPDWDEYDLRGMSKMFKDKIKADAQLRRRAEGRLVFLKARLSDLCAIADEMTCLGDVDEESPEPETQEGHSAARVCGVSEYHIGE